MLKHLGTFAILTVCLLAIAIVLGSCGEPIDQMLPPPVTPETDAPETGETETGETETDAPEEADSGHPYDGLSREEIEALEITEEEF